MAVRNHCIFIGRTGQDVDIKTFPDGNQIGSVSLAVDDSYKGKDGNKVEQTVWTNLVIPNHLCTLFEKYVPKGTKIAVETSYKTRTYQTKDGTNRWIHEFIVKGVEFLESKRQENNNAQAQPAQQSQQPTQKQPELPVEDNDDLPF